MKPNLFHEWLLWLHDLGGTYEPMMDLDEKTAPTGRRDPDTKNPGSTRSENMSGAGTRSSMLSKPSGQVVRID